MVDLAGPRSLESALVGPPHWKKLGALLPNPTNQPTPSGRKFRRLATIDLRLPIAGLEQVKESFELFELF